MSPVRPIRVAVIGCGYWGPNLVRNFYETEGVQVTAVCDRDVAALARIQKRYPSIQTLSDHRRLLRPGVCDAVAIATPVNTHYRIAKEALQAGLHVFIEKPLAASVREGEELARLAKKRGLTLLVDHTFVYHAPVRALKEHLPALGTLRYFDSVRVNLGLFQKDINVIWDLAPHDLSILFSLIDEDPVEVVAIGEGHLDPKIQNTAYLVLRFKNRFIAHFHFNWLSPVKVRQTLIGGSEKMIIYNDLDPIEQVKIYNTGVSRNKIDKRTIMVDYRTGDVFSPRIERYEALSRVTGDFVGAIREKRRPVSDAALGLRVLRVLEAADRSLAKGGGAVRFR